MSELPAWVGSAPVQELLNALADRLDSAQARGSANVQTVPLTKTLWPSFYSQPFESDREALWHQARELAKLGLIALTPERAARAATGYDMSPRIGLPDPARLRVVVDRPERVKSAGELWREAVNVHLRGDGSTKKVVSGYCIELEGHTPASIVQQINELHREAKTAGLLLREVSSRLFWGMSKVLDDRERLVAAVLGLDECPFPASPIQLQVVLPHGEAAGVLFVENAMSFEKAARSTSPEYRGMALVFASGFKASARRLRSADGASLFYSRRGCMDAAEVAGFERWLFQGNQMPVYFWGDLDWSGMRILTTLRESFGEVAAWQPGYKRMRERLIAGGGHRAEAADKRGQQPISATGCVYADGHLLPLLKTFGFVDQELFNF
jgi:hypothetical protein